MIILQIVLLAAAGLAQAQGQSLNCDLKEYKPLDGLQAQMSSGRLQITWQGERDQQLRAAFSIRDGNPVISELAVRKGGDWIVLGRDLAPVFDVVSGRRRISEQQLQPLRQLGLDKDAAFLDKEKWKAFWDAPLQIPGAPKGSGDVGRDGRLPPHVRRLGEDLQRRCANGLSTAGRGGGATRSGHMRSKQFLAGIPSGDRLRLARLRG